MAGQTSRGDVPVGVQLPPSGRLPQSASSGDLVVDRLEFLIGWYDRGATRSRITYVGVKLVQLVLAAAVPVTTSLGVARPVIGFLGGSVVLLEGVQQLLLPHDNWLRYRVTTEALLREKYLWAAASGDYATAANPRALLAQRTETLIDREGAQWVALQSSDSGKPSTDQGSTTNGGTTSGGTTSGGTASGT